MSSGDHLEQRQDEAPTGSTLESIDRTQTSAERRRSLSWGAAHRKGVVRACLATVAAAAAVIGLSGVSGAVSRASAAGSSRAGSREELLQTLGILRTSPTAADRAATTCIERTVNKFGEFKCYRYVPDYAGTVIWQTEHPGPFPEAVASMGNPRWELTLIRTVNLGSGRTGAGDGRTRHTLNRQARTSAGPAMRGGTQIA